MRKCCLETSRNWSDAAKGQSSWKRNRSSSVWSYVGRKLMWLEFVGSILCSERFLSGYSGFPLSSKTNIFKFQIDPGMHGHVLNEFLRTPRCSVGKQITFTLHLHLQITFTFTFTFYKTNYIYIYIYKRQQANRSQIWSANGLKKWFLCQKRKGTKILGNDSIVFPPPPQFYCFPSSSSSSILGSFSKPRRRRRRERNQTKGLMSRTIAVHVRFECWYISPPSSAKQQRDMTMFYVFWRTRTAMANLWYLL